MAVEGGNALGCQKAGDGPGKGPGRIGENGRRGRQHAVVDNEMAQALGSDQGGHIGGHVAAVWFVVGDRGGLGLGLHGLACNGHGRKSGFAQGRRIAGPTCLG